jgi:polyribonucleotide nucleotidyltransferase
VTTISSDQENDADILGIIGASTALHISHIPFTEIVAAVRVGMINGEMVVNPTFTQLDESVLNLVIAATPDHITMVEGGCTEISEEDLLKALEFGHQEIRKICKLIKEIREKLGKEKAPIIRAEIPEGLHARVEQLAKQKIIAAHEIADKQQHSGVVKKIAEETLAALAEQFPECETFIKQYLDEFESADLRRRVLDTSKRIDGRGLDVVRQITCEVGVLPRTHGSALFTRGQTQALVVVTLGTKLDEQIIDALEGESSKSYMLHYNFPAFATGEVKPARGPGRREIGHGVLAERALQAVLPVEGSFPYTIRIVADVLESNGSSSMATVCGGALALMDAGVPIKAPVAGISVRRIISATWISKLPARARESRLFNSILKLAV